MTNSGLISPQRERLLVSKSKWMHCIRVQKSSDTTLPQTQAKNAVRQYFRIIAHQKCQEALQCQEQKEKTKFNVHIFYSDDVSRFGFGLGFFCKSSIARKKKIKNPLQ